MQIIQARDVCKHTELEENINKLHITIWPKKRHCMLIYGSLKANLLFAAPNNCFYITWDAD